MVYRAHPCTPWIPDSTSWIPDSSLWIPDSTPWISEFVPWIPHSRSVAWISDSRKLAQIKDSGFLRCWILPLQFCVVQNSFYCESGDFCVTAYMHVNQSLVNMRVYIVYCKPCNVTLGKTIPLTLNERRPSAAKLENSREYNSTSRICFRVE